MCIDNHQRRPVTCILESCEGAFEHIQIVGIGHPRHVPAVADEPRRDVIAVRQSRAAFDGDLVVVIDPAKVGQFEVAGD